MNLIRVRNADTGAEADVPESALPMLRASNWELVSDAEAKAAEEAAAAEAAEADRAMTEAGLAAVPEENRPPVTEAAESADRESE